MIRSSWSIGAALVTCLFAACCAEAQVVIPPNGVNNQVAGVYVDTDGTVRVREKDDASDLAAQRLRAKAMNQPARDGGLTYVSIPRLLALAQAAVNEGKEVPEDLRYLSGLTQIRYVFVFPEDKDLVIAGPAEPIDAASRAQPIGKLTGRPVLHLDDLVVMLRLSQSARNRVMQAFGCSIDPPADCMEKSGKVMREYATATRGARMKAMKEAIGPQKVMLFGAPADTRVALVALAADYRLKRTCLALETPPLPGIGSAVDNSRSASNRFWFEASYLPLLVSEAGDAYEIRGPRLVVKCGAFSFDERGATDTAKAFARRFSEKIPQIAALVPAYADLQNLGDLAVLAALIRHDRLDSKAGMDLGALLASYKPAVYLTPTMAETLVNFTNGSIVAGGVSLDVTGMVGKLEREKDTRGALAPARARPSGDQWFARPK